MSDKSSELETIILYDKKTGESLEYWLKQANVKSHGFHIMDKNNSEITQIWLSEKQAKQLAFGILNSLTSELK